MTINEPTGIGEVALLREYLDTLDQSSTVHDQLEGLLERTDGPNLNLMEVAAQDFPDQAEDVVLLRTSRKSQPAPCRSSLDDSQH